VLLANITGDWYWIVLAIVILFGGSQLPKLARNAGDAMREFRKAHSEASSQGDPSFHSGSYQQPPAIPAPPVQAAPAVPAQAPAVPASQAPTQQAEERVSLTRAELDALLADREAKARASQSGATAQQQ
jgi:TatA/E family protein of Tat protein translocase